MPRTTLGSILSFLSLASRLHELFLLILCPIAIFSRI